eukprot:42631-Alexandrium_andersonii.AAC.1
MSASLVGSEMCIRDRYGSQCSTTQTWSMSLSRTSMTTTNSGSLPCARGSVSYTHLTLPTICNV